MSDKINWAAEMPSNELLREYIAKAVSWPDKYGIDVPIKDGKPLLGEALNEWIDTHRQYSSANDSARGVETASFGIALMIIYAELERGFAKYLEMNQ